MVVDVLRLIDVEHLRLVPVQRVPGRRDATGGWSRSHLVVERRQEFFAEILTSSGVYDATNK